MGLGDLIAGSVYKATFLTALNSGSGGFVVDSVGTGNNLSDIDFVISGLGSTIATGNKGNVRIPWAGTIFNWSVIADQVGSISIDILRANNGVPVTSIVGGGTKPNLTSQQFVGPTAPSGWTSAILAQNDYIGFNVVSAATVTLVTIILSISKI